MTGLMPPGPLAYEGQVVVPYVRKTFPPTSAFINFDVPTVWVDTANENAYLLVSKANNIATWVLLGGVPGEIDTITIPGPVVIVPSAANVNFLDGTGINITGSGNSITFSATGGGLTWTVVNSASQNIQVNNGYFSDSGGLVTFTLPSIAAVGDTFRIAGMQGSWTIAQGAGQRIRVQGQISTLGVGGSVSSNNLSDSIHCVCAIADTLFVAVDPPGGNLTVV